MFYADFDKLKIIKDYHAEKFAFELPNFSDIPIGKIKAQCDEALQEISERKGILTACFEIEISSNYKDSAVQIASEEEIQDFPSWVNVILTSAFKYIVTSEPRKREHRLDIPEKLKCLNGSLYLLKQAVNYQTIRERFNIIIKYKDLIYYLIDSKDIPEVGEFVHDKEEAPELVIKEDDINA